jgi:hypothetical protein
MGLQGFLLFVPDVTRARHDEQAAERERELD